MTDVLLHSAGSVPLRLTDFEHHKLAGKHCYRVATGTGWLLVPGGFCYRVVSVTGCFLVPTVVQRFVCRGLELH